MRIFNRAHLPWFIFVVLATAAAGLLYVDNFHRQQLSLSLNIPPLTGDTPGYVNVGATPLGLIFGSISFAIFLFAGLLGLRKKVVLWRIGSVQRWLRAHIWLTLLTIPLVILHTGFRIGGPMTTLLVMLYAVVMASGIYGLALQHYLPRVMKEKLPTEIVYEQIPYVRAQLCLAAENVRNTLRTTVLTSTASAVAQTGGTAVSSEVLTPANSTAPVETLVGGTATLAPPPDAASAAVLLEFIEGHALPYLRKPRADRKQLANPGYSEDIFRFLRLRVAEEYQGCVEDIQSWCDERRMLDYQTRLQHWLHGWLFVHVPLSHLLILMTGWHAFVTLFRY